MCTCVVPNMQPIQYIHIKKMANLLDRASKVVCIAFFSSFITKLLDFIRNYSKVYTILITFTPWNEFDFSKN